MKKIRRSLAMLLSVLVVFSLVACSGSDTSGSSGSSGYEIALVTDMGSIDDKSFNQGAWEGITKFAEDNGITYKYYQPTERSTGAYLDAIDLAILGGAKTVFTSGFMFEEAIYQAQTKYPDINFVILDGNPHAGDYVPALGPKTVSIFYKEHEAGYLAGYAAVKDGYKDLGFMGGKEFPAVKRFGLGFIEGANSAAEELGVDVNISYTYLGDFVPNAAYLNLASDWYANGTEVIFVAAGGAGNSIMKAAEQRGGKVIGVDVDQSSESETVITSAMKGLTDSVVLVLEDIYGEQKYLGQILNLGAKENGVSLPSDFSRFNTFNEEEYNKVFNTLVEGQYEFMFDTTAFEYPSVDELYSDLERTTVIIK